MITIKNHDIWIDFIFSIKGNLYQCKHTEELEDWYTFRFESISGWKSISGWNYPMFDVAISRDRQSEEPIMYRIQSQQLKSPGEGGGFSRSVLTKDEIRDKYFIEREMLRVLENSCG
jgi:hypothetical protein